MKKAVIFASYIPTKDKLYIGEEFLDLFDKLYSDYDLYVGVNPSCEEWIKLLEKKSINYDQIVKIITKIVIEVFFIELELTCPSIDIDPPADSMIRKSANVKEDFPVKERNLNLKDESPSYH